MKYPFHVILVLIILLLSILFLAIIKYKNESRDYKIYNFNLNAFYLWTYVFLFFCSIIYIRIFRWGFTLNLMDVINRIHLLVIEINILISITLCLLLCVTFSILLQVKNMLIRELVKRHIYMYFNKMYNNLLYHIKVEKNVLSNIIYYHPYVKTIKKLAGSWSYNSIINDYIYNCFILPYSIITEKETYPFWMDKQLTMVFRSMYKLILILIILYDCLYNDWTLHLIFYYLPFYIIISLYKKVTDFLHETNDELNRIIYECYYEEENVLYINTTAEEDNFILKYIANGFKCFSNEINLWEEKKLFYDFSKVFIHNRRFYKTKIPYIFQNNKGEQIDVRNNVIEKTYT